MRVKVLLLDKAEEFHHKVLDAMFGEDRNSGRVKFAELAKRLGVSEEVIRYNVKKLVKLGYISEKGEKDDGYELTKKVIFANLKNG